MDVLIPLVEAKEEIKKQIVYPNITWKIRAKLYSKVKLINNRIELISISKDLASSPVIPPEKKPARIKLVESIETARSNE